MNRIVKNIIILFLFYVNVFATIPVYKVLPVKELPKYLKHEIADILSDAAGLSDLDRFRSDHDHIADLHALEDLDRGIAMLMRSVLHQDRDVG